MSVGITCGDDRAILPSGESLVSRPLSGEEIPVEHPLQHSWAWWYTFIGKRTSYLSWPGHLYKISSLCSIEDFWCLYNNLKPASELKGTSDYHLFREGIEPKWEDPMNLKGGRWIIKFPIAYRELDEKWLYTALACLGEILDNASEEVCGAVLNVRKNNDKIAIWTRNAKNKEACMTIGLKLKEVLDLPSSLPLFYYFHSDSMANSNEHRYSIP